MMLGQSQTFTTLAIIAMTAYAKVAAAEMSESSGFGTARMMMSLHRRATLDDLALQATSGFLTLVLFIEAFWLIIFAWVAWHYYKKGGKLSERIEKMRVLRGLNQLS
jgi:hypothetical protein